MWNIIAVILAIALAAIGISQVFGSYKTGGEKMAQQVLQGQLATTISAISNAYNNNHNFSGFDNVTARRVGAIGQNWTGGGDATTPYALAGAGTILFASATVNGVADQGYQMTFGSLQQEACQVAGSLNVPQLVSVKIGATTYGNPAYGGTSAAGWPLPPATVATGCGGLGATDTVVLVFT